MATVDNPRNLSLRSTADVVGFLGAYSGMLPGGIELHEAFGVFERHDALW